MSETTKKTKPAPIKGLRDIDSIGYDDPAARKKIFEAAEAAGCEVVICQPNEIQIDLDKPWELGPKTSTSDFFEIIGILPYSVDSVGSWVSFAGGKAWKSRNGNTHIVLRLAHPDKFDAKDRVILAACLGSDPVRENINLKRLKDGTENPIALFRPKSSSVFENLTHRPPL